MTTIYYQLYNTSSTLSVVEASATRSSPGCWAMIGKVEKMARDERDGPYEPKTYNKNKNSRHGVCTAVFSRPCYNLPPARIKIQVFTFCTISNIKYFRDISLGPDWE